MIRRNWKVIKDDIRPAGPPGKCFYCGASRGAQHHKGCVIRERTVVVRTTIDRVISVPEDWDAGMIEFHRNGGSWCSDNEVSEISEMVSRVGAAGGCMCTFTETSYVREATADDERSNAWPQGDPHWVNGYLAED
jgi:hypothetical protein